MTDIEVGSLWVEKDDTWQLPFKVIRLNKTSVVTLDVNDDDKTNAFAWKSIDFFMENCTPYTPPKEYKVWVYEHKDGNVEVFRESQCSWFSVRNGHMTLKAILTGKEGDGL